MKVWFLIVSARYAWDFFHLLNNLSLRGWDPTYLAVRWPRIWIVTSFFISLLVLNLALSGKMKDLKGMKGGRTAVIGTVFAILLGFFLRLYTATALHPTEFEVFYAGLHFEDAELKLDAFRPIFYPYLQYAFWILLGRVHGFETIPQALTEGNIANRYPSSWIFSSRMLSVLMSTISLFLVWITTKNLFGERAGFWATLLHSVNHYVVTGPDSRSHDENPGILFLLASVAILTSASKKRDGKEGQTPKLVLSGVFSGLSFASRSPMLICVSSLTAFLWWSGGVSSVKYFILGLLSVLFLEGLAEFVITGGFLGGVFEFLRFNIIAGHASEWGTSPWYHYILLVSLIVGLVFYFLPLGIEKDSRSVLLGLLILPFLVAFSLVPHKENRYISPIVPFIHVLIGNALSKIDKKYPEVLATAIHTVIHGILMVVLW
jgi:4-amino-4-deoxy-L-arabinose transferase-like glycosyltransferase